MERTQFVKYAAPPWYLRVFEAAVFTRFGFDCVRGCTDDCPHVRKGKPAPHGSNYGRHGDEYVLVARYKNIDSAAGSLRLFSSFLRGELFPSAVRDERNLWPMGPLEVCFSFPHKESHVRDSGLPVACPFHDTGSCYPGVERPFEVPTTVEAALAVCDGNQQKLLTSDAFAPLWNEMARFVIAERDVALQRYAKLPRQCPACKGAGVVGHGGVGRE